MDGAVTGTLMSGSDADRLELAPAAVTEGCPSSATAAGETPETVQATESSAGASSAQPTSRTDARRLSSGLLWGQTGRMLDVALATVFSLVVIRSLSPDQYAVWSVAWSIIGTATLLTALGYSEMLQRFLPALSAVDPGRANLFARRLFLERIGLSLGVALILGLLRETIAAQVNVIGFGSVMWLTALLTALQGICDLLSGYYSASLRMREHTVVRVSGHALAIAVAFVLFATVGVRIWEPMTAMVASSVLSMGLYLRGARSALNGPILRQSFRQERGYGTLVWLSNVVTFGLSNHLSVLMIASLLSDAVQTSYFNVASVLLSRLQQILTGWNVVVTPHAAEARARGGLPQLATLSRLYVQLNIIALTPAFAFAAAWSAPLIETALGRDYAPAASLMTAGACFGLVSTIMGAAVRLPLLRVCDRQQSLLVLRVCAGLLNIGANAVLIPRMGAMGAIVASGISNITLHGAELILFHVTVRAPYPVAFAARVAAACGVAAGVSRMVPWSGLAGLLAGTVLYALVLLLALRVQRPLARSDFDAMVRIVPRSRGLLQLFTRR